MTTKRKLNRQERKDVVRTMSESVIAKQIEGVGDHVDNRLIGMQERLDTFEARLGTFEVRLASLERRLIGAIVGSITILETIAEVVRYTMHR